MPSTYAHRRFGADVLALLPDGLRATLEQHRELYDIGLHGPDLMFYYKALHMTIKQLKDLSYTAKMN